MTQEEKDLALSIFRKLMEDKENMNVYYTCADISVKAAKALYSKIQKQSEYDIELAEKSLLEKQRSEKQREAQKHAAYYIVYYHSDGVRKDYSVRIKRTIKQQDDFIKDFLHSIYAKFSEIGVCKVSKDDVALLSKYKTSPYPGVVELVCKSSEDFVKYINECPSAERIDLSSYDIGNAKIIF